MSENIEHRAFWNLPAPGIIARHYGTPSEHAGDAAEYYNYIHRNNYPQGTFGIDTGKIHKGETHLMKGKATELGHIPFNFEKQDPSGFIDGVLFGGGIQSGRSYARKQQEFINKIFSDQFEIKLPELKAAEKAGELCRSFLNYQYPSQECIDFMYQKKRESEQEFYERIAFLTGQTVEDVKKEHKEFEKTPFEKAIESVAEKDNDIMDYYANAIYESICEYCNKGQDEKLDPCKFCNGTGFKNKNDENKTSEGDQAR